MFVKILCQGASEIPFANFAHFPYNRTIILMTSDEPETSEKTKLKPEDSQASGEDADIHPLTPQSERLLEVFIDGTEAAKKAVTPIHVDEIASRIAKFYEMIRKVVDWKEDNVLRRSAIERALKRTLFPKISGVTPDSVKDTYRLAYTVTSDLIRGGHLPNDEIPQESVLTVETALKKYLYILKHAKFPSNELIPLKREINFATFIIELAACEIEEILTTPVKEQALLEAMTESMAARIRIIPQNTMSPEEKKNTCLHRHLPNAL
jgi:hypothetical protein